MTTRWWAISDEGLRWSLGRVERGEVTADEQYALLIEESVVEPIHGLEEDRAG